jgi:DNA-binding MarR family transcriptional regulator
MDPADFARRFETAYGDIYLLAVRRVRDKRERLSPETTAFLLHLAEAGPMSLTELSRHMSRAPSTLSEMIDHLEAKALVKRQTDTADARRSLVWLTPEGQARLADALSVLEQARLEAAAPRLPQADRQTLIQLLGDLAAALRKDPP